MEITKYADGEFILFTYVHKNGKVSTFGFKAYQASKNSPIVKFNIDCSGSCDCRERFFLETGAVECTCAACTMTVTQL